MTFRFYTLGCKLNFAESSHLARQLSGMGYTSAKNGEIPDICIVNTCTVTDHADKKARQLIHKLHKTYPGARIIATGCYAQLKPDEILSLDGVDTVLGANDKFMLPDIIGNAVPENGFTNVSATSLQSPFYPAWSGDDRTRHFLKIQDGCDYFCSYCAIPFARGRSRSAYIEDVAEAAREIAGNGGKEIILTGVNIGDFGKRTGEKIEDLVKTLDNIPGIERIRISSIEPDLLSDDLVRYIAESKKFAPHFHLPLQSGSDGCLKLMRRRYTASLFASKVELIKSLMPDAFIGVDVIVGTRGETPEFFRESYEFVERLPVSRLHVFAYSQRAGTAALRINPAVSPKEKKSRSEAMLALSDKKLAGFTASQIGSRRKVLWEAKNDGGVMYGFTENYLKVHRPFDEARINTIEEITVTDNNLSKNDEE